MHAGRSMQFLRGLACEQGQGYGVSRKQAPIWATSGEGECENSRMRERGYYAVWIVGHGVCGFAFMSTISLRLIVPPGLILPPSGQTPEPTPYPPTPPPGTPYPLGGRPTAYPPYCTLASRPECRPSLGRAICVACTKLEALGLQPPTPTILFFTNSAKFIRFTNTGPLHPKSNAYQGGAHTGSLWSTQRLNP